MASNRHLSKWRSFFWLLVVVGVTLGVNGRTEHIDKLIYTYAAKYLGLVSQERTLHLLHDGETAPNEPDTTTETRRIVHPTVGCMELNDTAAASCFATLPLGPQDMAVLLHKLSERGVKHLALSSPLTWQPEPAPIACQMVNMRLAAFGNAVAGMRGRTAADADFTPSVLLSSGIPADNVEGDTSGLPSANKAVDNALLSAPDARSLCWAPDRLEGERLTHAPHSATDRSYPLLVRWNGEIIPTLPLRLAMQVKGIKASDIHVRMGQDIRLGRLTLPLDEHGRTRLTDTSTTDISPETAVDTRAGATPLPEIMLLTQPADGSPEQARSSQIAATISRLCAKELVEYHTQPGEPGKGMQYDNPASGWQRLSILALVALFAVRMLPFFYSFFRKLIMLAALGGILWLAYTMMLNGMWFHITTALCAWLALALALNFLRPAEVRSRRRK